MNREESLHALATLAASPAAKWVGNKLDSDRWIVKCTRCGAEDSIKMPPNIKSPADVPIGFDEKLFAWKRDFLIAHEECAEEATKAH
jgi:hypothetical protein